MVWPEWIRIFTLFEFIEEINFWIREGLCCGFTPRPTPSLRYSS